MISSYSHHRIKYDIQNHRFVCEYQRSRDMVPYLTQPLVLNCDLTLMCNMKCTHCVARDMKRYVSGDLEVNEGLIEVINDSPFMVVVITGGEPLLPHCQTAMLKLVNGLRYKGIIVDTNGTIPPSEKVLELFIKKNVLVRVSLDSMRIQDEIRLRKSVGPKGSSEETYMQKLALIPRLCASGVKVAIQSVLTTVNSVSIQYIPQKLREWRIDQWYVQRMIPTSNKEITERLTKNLCYEDTFDCLERSARLLGIRCITKRDRRHNCVFLMVGNGQIYTQSEMGGEKIYLGRIGEIGNYYEFVCAPDHSARYYSPAATGS